MLNTYTVPCFFIDAVEKFNCYLSVSILASKNISGILFVVCFSPSMFFLPFPCILTQKCINHTYLVAIYTLNTTSTTSTPYFLFIIAKNLTFSFLMLFFGLQYINRTFFIISKLLNKLRGTLFIVGLLLKDVISAVFCSLTCNCISGTYLVAF